MIFVCRESAMTSILCDFEGPSDGMYIDPRCAFFDHFRVDFSNHPIYVLEVNKRRWLTDATKSSSTLQGWCPRPDLDWVVREFALQRGRPLNQRAKYLNACFQVVKEMPDAERSHGRIEDCRPLEHTSTRIQLSAHHVYAEDYVRQDGDAAKYECAHEESAGGEDDAEGDDDSEKEVEENKNDGDNVHDRDGSDNESHTSISSDGTYGEPESFSCELCLRPDTRRMIQCEQERHGDDITPHWFHYDCVGLTSATIPPAEIEWYCPDCKAGNLSRYPTSKYSTISESDNVGGVEENCIVDGKDRIDIDLGPSREVTRKPNADSVGAGEYLQSILGITEKPTLNMILSQQQSFTSEGMKRDVRPWNDFEEGYVNDIMRDIMEAGEPDSRTERRWNLASERLATRHHVYRTWTSIKNYWNRKGRQATGIEERNVARPDRMVTGVQDPKQRKAARQLKRERATSAKGPDDEEYQPSPQKKRQKRADTSARDRSPSHSAAGLRTTLFYGLAGPSERQSSRS